MNELRIPLTSDNLATLLGDDPVHTRANVRLEIELDPSAHYAPTREQARLLLDFEHDVTLIRHEDGLRAETAIICPVCPPSEAKTAELPDAEQSGHSGQFIQALPNTVREKLLASGACDALRTHEALAFLGWNDGREFDAQQAIIACKSLGVALKAVRAGLAENVIFCPVCHHAEYTECVFGLVGEKRRRGRPLGAARRYRLTTVADICGSLGIGRDYFDALPVTALRSAKAYRAALHAARLTRAAGDESLTRQLLAERLGVSKRTLRRYDALENVEAIENLVEIAITAANAATELPLSDRTRMPQNVYLTLPGSFRRYPPTQKVFHSLGVGLATLLRRTGNRYRVKKAALNDRAGES